MVSSVAVLAVLGSAYFGMKAYTNKLEEQKKQQAESEEMKTKVFSADAQDVQSLSFMIGDNEVTFTKADNSWVKEGEKAFPVSQDKIDTAVGTIDSIDAERVLENVEDLSEYGLDTPSNIIKVKTKNDNEELETSLRIGDKNDSTGQYYINKEDDPETVYLVSETVIEPFTDNLYDYAEADTFPVVDAATVTKVQVEGAKITCVLEKEKDTGFWNVGTDDSDMEKSDSAKAGSLTSSIGSMAYDKFVNYSAEDLSEYGLEKPFAKIKVDYTEKPKTEKDTEKEKTETEEKEETEDSISDTGDNEDETEKTPETIAVEKKLVIAVGDETEDDSRYVSVNGSKQIYTISNSSLSAFLGKTPSDFWDLNIGGISLDRLESVRVEYSGETNMINVSRETSVEQTENDKADDEENTEKTDADAEPVEIVTYHLDGTELDKTLFETFYNKLINMAGQERLTEKFHPENAPEMVVTFNGTENEKVEIEYYPYDSSFYAVTENEKVYLVNKMSVKDMMEAYTALQGKTETAKTE